MGLIENLNFKYNEYGLPILSDKRIERIAHEYLNECCPNVLQSPCRVSERKLLQYLRDTYSVKVVSDDLSCKGDIRILARIIFSTNTIIFDEELQKDKRSVLYRMTVAHEIGHWILHSHNRIKLDQSGKALLEYDEFSDEDCMMFDIQEIKKNISDFISNYLQYPKKHKLVTAKDWMEHHAKVFAGALLMPEKTFVDAFIAKYRQMRIRSYHRNATRLFLDKQKCNKDTYRIFVDYLQEIFWTSISSIKIRMQQLNLLIIDQSVKISTDI